MGYGRHMSLRSRLNASSLLAVSVFALGFIASDVFAETKAPSVETFVNEAVPAEIPSTYTHINAPLAPGSLTMEDVLSAHPKNAPKAPSLPSTSGLMLSEGLRSVLQRVGITSATPPTIVQAPKMPEAAPAQTPAQASAAPTPVADVSGLVAKKYGTAFEPGQAPKNLDGSPVAAAQASCSASVQKWEKSCGEAGYPSTFVGKISGETRGNCSDGTLQDVWVANTCAPPGTAAPQAKETVIAKEPEEPKAEATPAIVASAEEPDAVTLHLDSKESAPKEKESSGFFSRLFGSVFDTSEPDKEEVVTPAPQVAAETEEQPAAQESALPPAPQEEAARDANDFCGVAAETMAYEAPRKNLCRVGSASAVDGDGPWTWICTNNDGATSACKTLSLGGPSPTKAAASKAGKSALPAQSGKSVKAVCGAAAGQPAIEKPTSALCEEGKAGTVRGSNPWKWTCGAGKQKVSCATIKPVDGACGTANGLSVKTAPTKNLCKKGTPGDVNGEGPWVWSCEGSNGGTSASCSAPLAPVSSSLPPKPSVLKEKVEIPTPSKSLTGIAPTPVPAPAKVKGDQAPATAPGLSADVKPVPPPTVKDRLLSTFGLKEAPAEQAVKMTNVPLVLDPSVSTILFAHGSEVLDQKNFVALDKLVAALQKNPAARISLFAYADGTGSTPRAVKRLSLTRALAVRDYLASKSIAESRVDIHAEGAGAASGNADRVDVKVND